MNGTTARATDGTVMTTTESWAATELAGFWSAQVHELGQDLGWTYAPVPDAPETYLDLLRAFVARSRGTHAHWRTLPIYNGACETSIYAEQLKPGEHGTYSDPNVWFRFVHDMAHIAMDADFTYEGERRVIGRHLRDLNEAGGSLEAYRMLEADTLGQLRLGRDIGGFPTDQVAFVLDHYRHGYAVALANEVDRRAAQQ